MKDFTQKYLEEFDEKFEYKELKDLDSGYSVLVDRKDNCPMGYIQIESFLSASLAKVRRETLEELIKKVMTKSEHLTLASRVEETVEFIRIDTLQNIINNLKQK